MSYRFAYLSLIFFLIISSRLYGDTLKLKDFGEEVDATVVEFNEEFVKVIIPKREIGSLSIKSELPARSTGGDVKFPDAVFLSINGKENKVVCKIVKITKKPGSVTLQIPKERISAVQMAFPDSNRHKVLNAKKENMETNVKTLN
jgi:hypothetical protein